MKNTGVNQQGSALLITLSIMVLITIAAILAVRTAQTDIDLSFNQLHNDQAFYVAEAGLVQALHELNNDNEWTDGFVHVAFDEGTYTVAVVDSSEQPSLFDTVIVRATGTIRDANANLEAIVVPEYWRPFQYAMFGDSAVNMDNGTCTDSYNSDSGSYVATSELTGGDVASNGTLDFTNNTKIGGDASSALEGGIDLCATCTVYGDTSSKIDPFPIEPIPDSLFEWAKTVTPGDAGMSGDYDYDPGTYELIVATNETVTLSAGTYYFSSITLNNTSHLLVAPGEQVTIYLDGDFLVGNNSTVSDSAAAPADLVVFSRGDSLIIGQSTELYLSFYAPDTYVDISNDCDYFGSVVSYSSTVINSACVHYDRSLAEYEGGKTGVMKMIAWKEI